MHLPLSLVGVEYESKKRGSTGAEVWGAAFGTACHTCKLLFSSSLVYRHCRDGVPQICLARLLLLHASRQIPIRGQFWHQQRMQSCQVQPLLLKQMLQS